MSTLAAMYARVGDWGVFLLVDASVKATAVLLIAMIVARLLRGSSAAVRHRIWSLGLVGALVMPLLSLAVPPVRLPVLSPRAENSAVAPFPSVGVTRAGSIVEEAARGTVSATTVPERVSAFSSGLASGAQGNHQTRASKARNYDRADFRTSALAVWLMGLVIVLLPLASGVAANWLMLRDSRRLDSRDDLRLVSDLAAQIGLRRRVVTFESSQPVVPMTWGLVCPTVLLPRSWRGWTQQRQRCVLLHELAHIKRLDVCFQIVGRLAAGCYWFNPLAWYALRQLRIERELACDDCVLAAGERASDYARELVEIARLYRPRSLALGVAMACSARLDQRVVGILDGKRSRLPVNSRMAGLLFLASASLALVLAATSLGERSASAISAQSPTARQVIAPAKAEPQAGKAAEKIGAVAIQGRVQGPDGKAVANAKIHIIPGFPRSKEKEPPRLVATSEAAGSFHFSYEAPHAPGASPPQIYITADGYGLQWMPLSEAMERQPLTVVLPQDVPINGRILTLEGTPVVGATVNLRGIRAMNDDNLDRYIEAVKAGNGGNYQFDKYLFEAPHFAAQTTDQDGRFQLKGVGKNRVAELKVEARSIQHVHMRVMTLESEPIRAREGRRFADIENSRPPIFGASFEFLARPSKPIVGTIVDAQTGQPVSGVSVGTLDEAHATTDENGRFELVGCAKGKVYRLIAYGHDQPYITASKSVADTPGLEPLEVRMEMTRGIVVRGRITDKASGEPLAARVVYFPLYPNENVVRGVGSSEARAFGAFSERQADQNGEFWISVLPGPGFIGISAQNRVGYQPASVDAEAFFKQENTPYAPMSRGLENSLFVAHGGGGMGAMPQSQYHAIELLNLRPDAGDSVRRDVQLRQANSLTGVVLDSEGNPLTGATAYGLADEIWRTAKVLRSSEFAVLALGEGEKRRLSFRHDARRMAGAVEVSADTKSPLRVTLQPWGEVSGRLLDKEGQPLANLEIGTIGEVSDGETAGYLPRLRATDDEGRFHIDGLVPGLVYAIRPMERPDPKLSIVVKPGEKLDVGDVSGERKIEANR